jgi:hypothetical protein
MLKKEVIDMDEFKRKCNIANARNEYLSKLSEEERAITIARWKQKQREGIEKAKENREKVRTLAEITKALGEANYVEFDEDGDGISINEKCVSVAFANMIRNPKSSFKDINEMQKVIANDTDDGRGSLVVNFITNGQDLGD